MPRKEVLVTLVGSKQAKEGFTFIHRGSAEKCEGCEYLQACVKNLERERVYRVTGLRDRTLYCKLIEAEMRVVEVVESEIETATATKQAIDGAIILFQTQECDMEDCENFKLCLPKGLFNGERCEMLKVKGNLRCPRDFPLVRVVLRRVPAS